MWFCDKLIDDHPKSEADFVAVCQRRNNHRHREYFSLWSKKNIKYTYLRRHTQHLDKANNESASREKRKCRCKIYYSTNIIITSYCEEGSKKKRNLWKLVRVIKQTES